MNSLINKFYYFFLYKLNFKLNLNFFLTIYSYLLFFFPSKNLLLKSIRVSIFIRNYKLLNIFYAQLLNCNLFKNQKRINTEIIFYSLNKQIKLVKINKLFFNKESLELISFLERFKKISNSNERVDFIYNYKLRFNDNKNIKFFFYHLIHDYINLDCFCDDLSDFIIIYQLLDFKNKDLYKKFKKKKIFKITLNKWWFKGFGHYFYLDSLIKGIILKKVPFKKIYLDVEKKDIKNIYLFNKYLDILKKNKILSKNNKNALSLSLFCWIDEKYNFIPSDFLYFKINKEWIKSKQSSLIISNKNEKIKYKILCEKLGINDSKRVILIHIRKSAEFNNPSLVDFRDFNPSILIKVLKNFPDFSFILIGDKFKNKLFPIKDNLYYYSSSVHKSSKNDILLLLNASGCIGPFSGPAHLSATFGVPTLYLNCSQYWNFPVIQNNFFIPSYFFIGGQPLKFRSFLKIKPPIIWSNDYALSNLNIKRKFNTYEELKSSISEFISYLHGKKINFINITLKYLWWKKIKSDNYFKIEAKNYFKAPVLKSFVDLRKSHF